MPSSPSRNETPLIETVALRRTFGEKVAVEGLDLAVGPGEFFCFLGPNGAGKTTTIKMITGLLRPTSGTARVGGHDVGTDPIAAKRLLGYIPDHPYLYEKLTTRELMRFVAGLHGLEPAVFEERCDPLLEQFELLGVADQLVESYSHGMRQRLSFASCFLPGPRVVVVDEPWVGLDPRHIRRVKVWLKDETRERGLAVFMSTHTLSIAEELADRIGILHRGRLLHVGTVAEIKALARDPGTLEDVFLELTSEPDPSAA